MKTILIALLFASCCPARNQEGKPWPARDVIHRMFARPDRNHLYTYIARDGMTITYPPDSAIAKNQHHGK